MRNFREFIDEFSSLEILFILIFMLLIVWGTLSYASTLFEDIEIFKK